MSTNDLILARILEIRSLKCKSVNSFADVLDMPQATVNNYILGKRKISLEFIISILSSFEDISAEWLFRGEGSMLRTSEKPESSKKPAYVIPGQNEETYISGSTAHIPIDPSLDRIIRLLEQKDAQIERLISLLTSH